MVGGKAHNLLCGLPASPCELPALAGTNCGALWSQWTAASTRVELDSAEVGCVCFTTAQNRARELRRKSHQARRGANLSRNRREKCARGMIAGRSCILSARSRICATRSDVTWRLRPHNIVLVPAAGELLASSHRCHVRASRKAEEKLYFLGTRRRVLRKSVEAHVIRVAARSAAPIDAVAVERLVTAALASLFN